MQQISFTEYLTTGHFVEAAFENWQSEFLSVFSMVVLTIILRRQNSQSKPVDAPDAQTGK